MKFHDWPLVFLCALFLIGVLGLPAQAQAAGQQGLAAAATPTPVVYRLPIIMKQPTPMATPMPTPHFPVTSPSYYVNSRFLDSLYAKGCALGKRDLGLVGKQDSVVILSFGYPQYNAKGDGLYGTRGYGAPLAQPFNTREIAAVVQNFGQRYWDCVGADFDSHLRIAVGTTNYDQGWNLAVNYDHGKAWAQMVNQINDWFVNACPNRCDGQVDAVGANDIELAWSESGPTIDWLDGYASAAKYPMYNFGSLDGCPFLSKPTYNCHWYDKDKVWYAIWGSPPVQPVPEIYRTDGVSAEQWYLMSVYAYKQHGEKIHFVGPLTELRACQQNGGCLLEGGVRIDNSPENAWNQMNKLLNGDPRTDGELLPYSTDIEWIYQ